MDATATAIEIKPQPGPQEAFLSSSADVVFFGGAAGGGKTFALLMEPLRHVTTEPGFGAVIFRRKTTQISMEGGLWDESKNLYAHPSLRGYPREHRLDWTFAPYDNSVKFAHMEHEKNRLDYLGAQIPLICFDQVETFTRKQFFYMFSRNRSTCDVRPYIRATYNPVPDDDIVGGWIHEFVGWYLDDNGQYPDPEKTGTVRWFVNMSNTLHWYDSADAARDEWPDVEPMSFTFIPASVFDNRILLERDPGYVARLQALDNIEQARLLHGDHKIRPEAGKVFNRDWFPVIDAAPPSIVQTLRFWDFAATEKKRAKGAATAGVKMGITRDKRIIILDVIEEFWGSAEIDAKVMSVAQQDGKPVSVFWEEEGGSSGKRSSATLGQKLTGYKVKAVRPTGDKLERSRPLAAQAKLGNVLLVRGDWNDRFLSHMHNIPDGRFDIHDAAAGAYNALANDRRPWAW